MKSVVFLVACMACLLDRTAGLNYYLQSNYASPELLTYPLISPIPAVWQQPDCDTSKETEKSESSESNSSENSPSEISSSEGKESGPSESSPSEVKESGPSNSGNEESKKNEERSDSKEKESLSKEESSVEDSKEGNSEESGEKKNEGKEKEENKFPFPPRTYDFVPRQVQKVAFSPVSYFIQPYRSRFVAQPSPSSYPIKSSYQYVPVPAAANIVDNYVSPAVSKYFSSPITRIMYSSSGLNYPSVSKAFVSPGARLYARSWSSPIGYFKK